MSVKDRLEEWAHMTEKAQPQVWCPEKDWSLFNTVKEELAKIPEVKKACVYGSYARELRCTPVTEEEPWVRDGELHLWDEASDIDLHVYLGTVPALFANVPRRPKRGEVSEKQAASTLKEIEKQLPPSKLKGHKLQANLSASLWDYSYAVEDFHQYDPDAEEVECIIVKDEDVPELEDYLKQIE